MAFFVRKNVKSSSVFLARAEMSAQEDPAIHTCVILCFINIYIYILCYMLSIILYAKYIYTYIY